jgi:hypothetical protein
MRETCPPAKSDSVLPTRPIHGATGRHPEVALFSVNFGRTNSPGFVDVRIKYSKKGTWFLSAAAFSVSERFTALVAAVAPLPQCDARNNGRDTFVART